MKTCTKCGETKPADSFGLCSYKGKTYHRNVCRACIQASKNKQKVKAQNHKSYIKHREKRLAETKEYARTHPEVRQRARKKWEENNPEALKQSKERWKRKNPEKVRAKSRRNCNDARDRLADWVIRKDLIKKGFRKEKITQELIETQRALVSLKRKIKEIENGN
jgi:hypothetical protein